MLAECLFLGTGGSAGIPMIGCKCAICTSSDAHDRRLRPSVLLTVGDKYLLIDSGPDFRQQALNYKIDHLDGVLLTHSHFDHVAGLDELRAYYLINKTTLPVLASQATLDDLKRRYDYFFREKNWGISLSAQLIFHLLEGSRGTTDFLDIPIKYVTYEQGGMLVNGYRLGSLAYISDIRHYPKTIFEDLQGIDILVLGVLREKSSMMHFNVEEGIAFSQKVGAKHTYFTHIGHETKHNLTLPKNIHLAFDGLKVKFSI